LTVRDPLSTAHNIFQWVADNLTYSGYVKDPRGACYALQSRQGDCTEFMYLFIALCRAAGIPARGLGGYVTDKNAILKSGDYHNWAEFYVNGRWRLADPHRQVFMPQQAHYVVMRILGTSPENPMGQYDRFRSAGEGFSVIMN
jgi:transglutaminase-like putative cysteine protease